MTSALLTTWCCPVGPGETTVRQGEADGEFRAIHDPRGSEYKVSPVMGAPTMKGNHLTTDVKSGTADVFLSMPAGSRVGGHVPASDTHLDHLNLLAKLCLEVEAITADENSPEEILLHQIARLTGGLIATRLQAGHETIVREWVAARCELLLARLSSADSAGTIGK